MNARATYQSKRLLHHALRKVFSAFPRFLRFAVYRSFVECDPNPDKRLVFKIAETRQELEACFHLLHDAYVGCGFMRPDPSGMRVNIYHALPTTTTLCAEFDGEVVGTISLIRESLFGFPLQSVFDLHEIRLHKGQIAEVSALAVHPRFRNTGGSILFPLMKFMYEYCSNFFDTRHLVIAVNPNRIELYESLLLFERLTDKYVDSYDFANGAPAVGAYLDLHTAPGLLKAIYDGKSRRKNLYQYFRETKLHNIIMPSRRYFTANGPVMTPELLDYFFNRCTHTFEGLSDRERVLLHSIYNTPQYKPVLPVVTSESETVKQQRAHQRYSLKCPGSFTVNRLGEPDTFPLKVVEFSDLGFQAYSSEGVPTNVWGEANIRLGSAERSIIRARAVRVRRNGKGGYFGFTVEHPDLSWRKLVQALKAGATQDDLSNASRFLLE
jgi:GNAT superfamily N-acetyltransferase